MFVWHGCIDGLRFGLKSMEVVSKTRDDAWFSNLQGVPTDEEIEDDPTRNNQAKFDSTCNFEEFSFNVDFSLFQIIPRL